MKSLKLPALRAVLAVTALKERRVFLLLVVVASSISLISARKGGNSLIPLLPPIPSVPMGHLPLTRGVGLSPPNPLALGFGGDPILSPLKAGPIRFKPI